MVANRPVGGWPYSKEWAFGVFPGAHFVFLGGWRVRCGVDVLRLGTVADGVETLDRAHAPVASFCLKLPDGRRLSVELFPTVESECRALD